MNSTVRFVMFWLLAYLLSPGITLLILMAGRIRSFARRARLDVRHLWPGVFLRRAFFDRARSKDVYIRKP